MKDIITGMIRDYVKEYEKSFDTSTVWGEPLVGFADARHPDIINFKETISPSHKLPSEVLESASVVVAYFVPFSEALAYTNRFPGDVSSPEWALAYEETNAMFRKLNAYLIGELSGMGFEAAVSPEATTFDQEKLISNWSHRHFARVAGLGTFGLNNMLITRKGCCGRYSTVVTNLNVEPDLPLKEELCIYYKNGRCGGCVKRCPSGALSLSGFDRQKCYQTVQKNAERYQDFGSSYFDASGGKPNSVGSDVCGKCATCVPCSFFS